MPIIDWLFDAKDTQIEELQTFLKNPIGDEPEIFHLLYGAMRQFSAPDTRGWAEETGFRVAVRLIEEDDVHQFWGDLRGLPEGSWKYLLQHPGDFMVLGNLSLFDIHSWKRTGDMLATLKKKRGMGKKLGLLPGIGKGMIRPKKKIVRDMTWRQIREAIHGNPDEEKKLCSEYVNKKSREYIEEYKDSHELQLPHGKEMRKVTEQARKYFNTMIRKRH